LTVQCARTLHFGGRPLRKKLGVMAVRTAPGRAWLPSVSTAVHMDCINKFFMPVVHDPGPLSLPPALCQRTVKHVRSSRSPRNAQRPPCRAAAPSRRPAARCRQALANPLSLLSLHSSLLAWGVRACLPREHPGPGLCDAPHCLTGRNVLLKGCCCLGFCVCHRSSRPLRRDESRRMEVIGSGLAGIKVLTEEQLQQEVRRAPGHTGRFW
jgi:hypothetical protein